MTGMDKWNTYFSVSAGASATLTGLIFVGISINLQKILQFRQLPGRALSTLALLTNNLLVSSFCLIPNQPFSDLGLKIIVLILFVWGFNMRLDIKSVKIRDDKYWIQSIQNLVFNQLAISPFIVGSILLINANPAGLSWLIAGITMSFIKAIVDAWVLLIEIQR
jgi:hypothetical protein